MNFRPPEWQQNKELWLAWPYDKELWQAELAAAQDEFVALVKTLSQENLAILVPSEIEAMALNSILAPSKLRRIIVMPYSDIWLRDTLPIYVRKNNHAALLNPKFNGWGKKFLMEHDRDLRQRAVAFLGLPEIKSQLVLEGGAVECDGQGTLLTTESCMLNKNRNPNLSKEQVDEELKNLFGVSKIIWLKDGLLNDHTDGHIDTIARFIAPRKVMIMMPREKNDPNYEVMHEIKNQLQGQKDALGQTLELIELPSPNKVIDRRGQIMPASFLNFIIADHCVVMPVYNTPYDNEAREILQKHCELPVIALSAKSILSGGGAFHCISQEFYPNFGISDVA